MYYSWKCFIALFFDVITNIIKFMEITNGAWQVSGNIWAVVIIEKNGLLFLVGWFAGVRCVFVWMSNKRH